jgi:hypothetical protein
MKRYGRVGVVLTCALLALVVPPGASAGQHAIVKHKSLEMEFNLPSKKGYSISVYTEGHRQVRIRVANENVLAYATYTALGRVTRKGIAADFGRFGQISLRFRSKSRVRGRGLERTLPPPLPPPLRHECKGRDPVREHGLLTGDFRFEGEHGYVRAAVHRIRATLLRSYKEVCRWKSPARAGASASARPKIEALMLTLAARRQGVARDLFAISVPLPSRDKKHPEGVTIAFATRNEKVGRVGTSKKTFVHDDVVGISATPRGKKPLVAEAKLPSPFAGTGTYLEKPGQEPSWSGDFGVHLPGSGRVPLTGDEFDFAFCRAITDREFDRCADNLDLSRRPLALFPQRVRRLLAQGSGSHSQPLALARLSSLR